MRRIFLIAVFLLLTPPTLIAGVLSLQNVSKATSETHLSQEAGIVLGVENASVFSSLPAGPALVGQEILTDEARPIIIRQYLERHNSPIVSYADTIFDISQKYGLDYRLMISIAQCESNLCKRIPEGSYNCWGFENGETKFRSWEQAFNQVAKTLKERYYDKGLVTPDEIMPKYAPPAMENGGSWAKCVNQFYQELE